MMNKPKNNEYTKALDVKSNQQISDLLKKEGSKSKFRTKIQMVMIYILASALMLICLLATNYTLYDQNKLYYLPLIICSILSFSLYFLYFFVFFKNLKTIKDYVQKYWIKLYYYVVALSIANFVLSFIFTLIPVCQHNDANLMFVSNLPIYTSILAGIILNFILIIVATGLDRYVIYHLETDLQRLVSEYEEDKVEWLQQKIQEEAQNVKQELDKQQIPQQETKKEQKKLTQAEIDEILKNNSAFDEDNKDQNEQE